MSYENIFLSLLALNGIFFILLIIITISLDSKLWAKLDRVVNIIILERQEIVKKIESILTRIEEIEKRLNKVGNNGY